MNDLNKNNFDSENIGDNENNKERNESNVENQYSEGKENCQESEKNSQENSQDQQKILPQEQESDLQEGEGASPSDSQASSINSSNSSDYSEKKSETATYSSSYEPPYYVPNFTVSTPNAQGGWENSAEKNEPKSKKRKKWVVPVIIVSILVGSFIIGMLGLGLGYLAYNGLDLPNDDSEVSTDDSTEVVGDETVTIIKNDGSIEVDEQIGSTGYSGLSVSEITALVADSVVEISTSQKVSTFYGQYITSGAGSGVIIGYTNDKNAYYIVTNYHVIDGADTVKIRLRNGNTYDALVVGGSALDDLAILRISAKNGEKLTTATLGKSSKLKVGDGVVAIGNPLGTLGGTVTDGIISALDREIMVENNVMVLLQTNAAINPGNSGGGLFNSAGELIGIVNAKQADTGIEGLGFAIPIDRASECIDDILEYGYVKGHASLGVKVQTVSLSSGFSSNTYVQVTEASVNSSLKVGDVIYSVNGETVSSVATFNASVYQLEIGDEIQIQVIEKNTLGQNVLVTKTVKVIEYNPNDFSK